jgi:hypothetical protein
MKHHFLTAIAVSAMALMSCSTDTDTLGSSLTNESDKLNVSTGIYQAHTRSVLADSVFARNFEIYFGQVKDPETGAHIKTGKVLPKERYGTGIMKYLEEKFNGEKYKIEKMVTYDYSSKYRENGKKPKSYTYVVISQKVKGSKERKFTRMIFDSKGAFQELLAQPLDEKDVQ